MHNFQGRNKNKSHTKLRSVPTASCSGGSTWHLRRQIQPIQFILNLGREWNTQGYLLCYLVLKTIIFRMWVHLSDGRTYLSSPKG